MALKKINYTGQSKVILRLCEMVNQLIDGGGGGGGSTVTYTSLLSSGTKTGEIEIDGISTDMYAPTPPTKLSDLSNDAGFIDSTVNNLVNYYKKTETYTQAEVNALISAIVTLNILVVQTLPTQDISTTTIYLVPKATAETQDVYDEYIYVNNAWEHIGSTQVDLTNYYTKTETDALLADKVDKVTGKQLSTEDFTSALKSKLEGIEAGAQANVQADWNQTDNTADDYIKNKPTIPSGSGGHVIENTSGTDLPQEDNLQFVGVYTEDDSTNDRTKVNVVREMTKTQFDALSSAEKEGFIHITDEPDNPYQHTDASEVSYGSGTVEDALDGINNRENISYTTAEGYEKLTSGQNYCYLKNGEIHLHANIYRSAGYTVGVYAYPFALPAKARPTVTIIASCVFYSAGGSAGSQRGVTGYLSIGSSGQIIVMPMESGTNVNCAMIDIVYPID